MSDTIAVINAGSSSIKFSLFELGEKNELRQFISGAIENIGIAPHFLVRNQAGKLLIEKSWIAPVSHTALLSVLIAWIDDHLGPNRLVAAGHRVAHGGNIYSAPILITHEVLSKLRALIPLAPLHQPHNLAPIDVLAENYPGLKQVACFDTAFHMNNSRISRLYGLPRAMTDEGLWRYGFHGLSYEYIAYQFAQIEPQLARGRVIVAHLGNGASMCAIVAGESVASTMGFSALDGLVMGSRCGSLDPGVILYLMKEKKMSAQEIEALLYGASGLLGVSGISNDMRTLLANDDARAKEAIELFVYRLVRELGSLAAASGGIDALIFTGGIGENSPAIRANVCKQVTWMGIQLDAAANDSGDTRISAAGSKVSVFVLPTDEDLMIAKHSAATLFSNVSSKSAS